jgi:hypothetical protein
MNYDIAKELKDAGFHAHEANAACPGLKCDIACDIHCPTLEELIEAVRQDGRCVEFILGFDHDNNWSAQISNRTSRWFSDNVPNPTEAVARLWLALNKKT